MARSALKQRGFTLVEVITVVVILAIVAVIGTSFMVSSTESYMQTRSRANLINTGRQAIERMTRQLRGVLPHSVRVTNGGDCLEFLPIAGGGIYLNAVPDAANGAPETGTIDTSIHEVEFGSADYISIGAMASDELYGVYGASPMSRSTVTNRTNNAVNFSPAIR